MASIGLILFTLLMDVKVMTRAIMIVNMNIPMGTKGLF